MFSNEEIDRLKTEIPVLEVVLWYLRFVETAAAKRVPIDDEEFNTLFGLALRMALQDVGVREVDLDATRGRLVGEFESYWEAFVSAARCFGLRSSLLVDFKPYADREEGDIKLGHLEPFFLACHQLPRRTLPSADLRDSIDYHKRMAIFYVAKQMDERQTLWLANLLSRHKLVNS